MQDIAFVVNPPLTDIRAIADLREAVGWERQDEDYHVDFLPKHAAFYTKGGLTVGLGGVIGA